jgi:hypothetical protein
VKVRLHQPLTNAGVRYDPGSVVTLDEDTAKWAIMAGIAEAVKKVLKVPAAPAENKE